jgi:hypothetical protein
MRCKKTNNQFNQAIMKKIVFTLSIAIGLVTSAFASETSKQALRSFASNFSQAREVTWSETDGFHVAKFRIDNKTKYAYYTESGDLKVVAEQVSTSDLSDKQKHSLYKDFENFTISDLYRLEDEEGTKVFAVVESDNRKVILSSAGGQWKIVSSRSK